MTDTKPSDTKMSGGQAAPKEGDASLAENKDAVPMKNLSTDTDAAVPNTTKPSASTRPENTAKTTTDGADDSIEPSNKGKEKELAAQSVAQSQDDSLAIGPSVDDVQPVSVSPTDGLVCNITLLLTTGARHPYKLDEKYLTKRNVNVPGLTEAGKKDPFSISVYTLKELILREWRDEWDPKPASPSSIRLIHFGKLLDDKDQLRRKQPHGIHDSIRFPLADISCRVPLQRRGGKRRPHDGPPRRHRRGGRAQGRQQVYHGRRSQPGRRQRMLCNLMNVQTRWFSFSFLSAFFTSLQRSVP